MNEAALKAELRAQVMRVQDCEREIDRLHQEIHAQKEIIKRLQAATPVPRSADPASPMPAEWVSPITDRLHALQASMTRLTSDASGQVGAAAHPLSAVDSVALARICHTVPLRQLRLHRSLLAAHPQERDAARLTASEDDGQHSAVHVIRPLDDQLLIELQLIAAPGPLDSLRIRLSGEETGWSLVLPCHLGDGRAGRLRTTGAAPVAEGSSRRLPGGWSEFTLSFPRPVTEAVVVSFILSRDLSKTSAHFVGTARDAVDLHSLTIIRGGLVQGPEGDGAASDTPSDQADPDPPGSSALDSPASPIPGEERRNLPDSAPPLDEPR
jgi:hypothetical protein